MTGFKFQTRPLIGQVIVPTFREAVQRHVRVIGGVDPISRYVGGYAGAGQNQRVTGSASVSPYGGLEQWYGCTANGHGVEWDLGLLETNADWTINFFFFQNTTNAQVGIYMDDVLCGATIEQYSATATNPASAQRDWAPAAGVGRLNHRIAIKVTGKHASSTGRFISVGGLLVNRKGVAANRAL